MIYLAYFTMFFFSLRFLVSTVNILFIPVLKNRKTGHKPLVSVLIPARNEEYNIPYILDDIINQDYTNIEVIIFNDLSTDKTAQLISHYTKTDNRVKLINSEGLPEGWTGKNYGCYRLSQKASGNYLLFLDADVRVGTGLIESALAQIQKHQLKLLSIFPKQEMLTLGEKITVPIMNTILLSLLPMILTRESHHPSLAAANGQFMMFERNSYMNIQPHEQLKQNKVEDILTARLFKKEGLKIQCMTGNDSIRCRMYQGAGEAIRGFSKNIAEFFGGSHIIALLYWLTGSLGIFAVIFYLPLIFTLITIALITGITIFMSWASLQPSMQNIILSIPQQFATGAILFQSMRNKLLKRTRWKGRNII
ncbi:MAG: glycosyltransferase [Bacteroidales bacterium]|nr:glycosyltransferase [Bacteroidales bacterium]